MGALRKVRKNVNDEEFNLLVRANAGNNFELLGRSVADSREIRQVAIDALRIGQDLKLAFGDSRFKLTGPQIRRVKTSSMECLLIGGVHNACLFGLSLSHEREGVCELGLYCHHRGVLIYSLLSP